MNAKEPWQRSDFIDSRRYNRWTLKQKLEATAHERQIIRGPGKLGSPECNVLFKLEGPYADGEHLDRIVACVNALIGVKTEDLPGAVEKLVERVTLVLMNASWREDEVAVDPRLIKSLSSALIPFQRNKEGGKCRQP